ncbi:MAG: energy transducer TonB [Flavobacteriales bacterium]|jgi:protein TonB
MKKTPPTRRRFELGLLASLAFILAAFEWTVVETGTTAFHADYGGLLLEPELVPAHTVSKPAPPQRPLNIVPIITPDPPKPDPNPVNIPAKDPLLGKLHTFNFDEFGSGDGDEEIETVLVAEHMPHFRECTNVLDRDAERSCTEQSLISLIQSCAKFPPMLRESGIGGVVFVQFNVDEFGKIRDAQVLKEAHPKLNRAALQALDCIPQMEPGTQQGRPVRVTYTIPVRFTIR